MKVSMSMPCKKVMVPIQSPIYIQNTSTALHCADWSQIFSSLDQMEYRTCPVENYDSTRPTKGQIYDCWPLETAMYGSSSGGYSQK